MKITCKYKFSSLQSQTSLAIPNNSTALAVRQQKFALFPLRISLREVHALKSNSPKVFLAFSNNKVFY